MAVCSSATAEDLPGTSFARQQETFSDIGGIGNVLQAVREVVAFLYDDPALAYRFHQGFALADVAVTDLR